MRANIEFLLASLLNIFLETKVEHNSSNNIK